LTDEDKILQLKRVYKDSQIKVIGNETPIGKAKNDIVADIQMYNTLIIRVFNSEFLTIGVYTNAQPVVYYFKNECSNEEVTDILNRIEEFCSDHDIEFNFNETSCFEE
jgi:hypothetical protein